MAAALSARPQRERGRTYRAITLRWTYIYIYMYFYYSGREYNDRLYIKKKTKLTLDICTEWYIYISGSKEKTVEFCHGR